MTCRVFTKRDLKKGIYRFMGQIGGTCNFIQINDFLFILK